MGEVHLAVQRTLGRKVAIKLLLARGMEDPTMRERFQREVLIMSTLNHPSIVTVFESETLSDGAMFIVMEFVEGSTLEDLRTERPPGDWRQVLAWTRELAAALDFAHTRGIVHRDIKPHNIMIGANGHVKVMDFGIAKNQGASHLTHDTIIGTPSYMSPEQARGGKIDGRSDLYSLGCVMYAMIAGRPVFGADGESSLRVIQDQISAPPVLLSKYAPHVPAPVVRLVHDLLAKAPADRPASAAELLTRLDALDVELNKGALQKLVDTFNVYPRLARGELARFDLVLLEILLPGFGHFQRGNRALGAVLAVVSLVLFFLPFGVTLSVLIRVMAAAWMYVISYFQGRVSACLEFARHNQMVTGPLVVAGVLVMLVACFLVESELSLRARSRPPEVALNDPKPRPRPTPAPEPTPVVASPRATPTPPPVVIEATPAPATPTPAPEATTPAMPSATPRVLAPTPTPPPPRVEPTPVPATPSPAPTNSLADALAIRPRSTPWMAATPEETPRPRPTAAPRAASWSTDGELIDLAVGLQRDRDWELITEALNKLHAKATPNGVELATRTFLGYALANGNIGSYNRGRNSSRWTSWETDAGAMMEGLRAGDKEETEAVFQLAMGQSTSSILNFTTGRNLSPYFAGPEYRDRLAAGLRSRDEEQQVSALVLLRDVNAPELSADVARFVSFRHGGLDIQSGVRGLAIGWLKQHGTAAAIPALDEAIASNKLLSGEYENVRRLVSDILPKRPA